MMQVLEFLAGIKSDQAGLSFALPRTIQKGTGLSLHDVCKNIEEAEREGLVRTMRTSLSDPYRIISVMITEKGRSKSHA
jgi:DNA-binding MarR family transcriptional regulator